MTAGQKSQTQLVFDELKKQLQGIANVTLKPHEIPVLGANGYPAIYIGYGGQKDTMPESCNNGFAEVALKLEIYSKNDDDPQGELIRLEQMIRNAVDRDITLDGRCVQCLWSDTSNVIYKLDDPSIMAAVMNFKATYQYTFGDL